MIAFQAASTVPPSGTSTSSRSCPVASRYRAKRRTRTRTCCLEAVRLTAAAGRLDVGVLDGEPGAHHVVLDEVDLAAAQVGRAVLVDVHLDALRGLDDIVVGLRLVFPAELIGHPGAATPDDADAQTPLGLAFLEPKLGNLLGGRLAHRNHSILP